MTKFNVTCAIVNGLLLLASFRLAYNVRKSSQEMNIQRQELYRQINQTENLHKEWLQLIEAQKVKNASRDNRNSLFFSAEKERIPLIRSFTFSELKAIPPDELVYCRDCKPGPICNDDGIGALVKRQGSQLNCEPKLKH